MLQGCLGQQESTLLAAVLYTTFISTPITATTFLELVTLHLEQHLELFLELGLHKASHYEGFSWLEVWLAEHVA